MDKEGFLSISNPNNLRANLHIHSSNDDG